MRLLDITIDLETCSLSSHAAIMQIAAVAWDRLSKDDSKMFFGKVSKPGETEHFVRNIDLNSQFVEGLWDFDQNTADWWGKQKREAKRAIVDNIIEPNHPVPTELKSQELLNDALEELDNWIRKMLSLYKAENFCIWCQGTDFDIPILRYAAERTQCNKLLPMALHHKYFRDCRTAIYECTAKWLERDDVELPYTKLDLLNDPTLAYKLLPQLPESFGGPENAHDALYDCVRSSWFTWQALRLVFL